MKRFVLAAAVVFSAGCKQQVATPPPPPLKVLTDPTPSMPDGHPALSELAIASRGPRRMSVDQLERSLDQMADLPAGTVKLPADLAVTLGRPDYKRVTEEQLQPTPLFMKFMLDLSTFYCQSLAGVEATRPADQKFFTRFPGQTCTAGTCGGCATASCGAQCSTTTPCPSGLEENIRFLTLRFTGLEGPDADPYVARLKVVYEAGSQAVGDGGTPPPLPGYQAVCAALFTSPEFLLY